MDKKDPQWKLEEEWLKGVLLEIKKQFNEKRNFKESFKKDAIKTQRELWQDIGSVSISNGLEQIVDFMQFIDTMKMQKRNHDFTKKLEEKYEKMLLEPYFGRIDFLEKGQDKVEKCYIGISNLINENYDFLIYDWRAPISSMFYDYEIGEAQYNCPEGIIKGKLKLKRQYKISNGEIEYMFDSNLKIDDEILQDMLSKSTSSKMKAIITTIQREQNKVIRNEEFKNLIVQGPAGSGKTSVALHRIAYLLYKHREEITPKNIVIFSPNDIFNDYISNVLPQLGEDNMYQTTFKRYMNEALGDKFKKESYSEMMEYILNAKNSKKDIRLENIKFKASEEFIYILKAYVNYVQNDKRDFLDLVFRGKVIITSGELRDLFFKDYAKLPLKRRLQKLKARILFLIEPYEKHRIEEVKKELKETDTYFDNNEALRAATNKVKIELKDIYYKINKLTEFDLTDIYKKFFEKLEFFTERDVKAIKSYSLENLNAKQLNYEDQLPLLYLKGALGDKVNASEIKYVIIDEAQDYTALQYEIFHQLFKDASMTILGDLNQAINPFMNLGSYKNISSIFTENNTCMINLKRSYRSTMEITKFARKILNSKGDVDCVERNGEEPIILGFNNEELLKTKLLKEVKGYKAKGFKSIAIITRTAREAEELYNFLKDKLPLKAIMKEEEEFINDIVVIPAYLAKGLEFDVVFIYKAGDEDYKKEEDRLLLYTACTRALHVLCIYYIGNITRLIS